MAAQETSILLRAPRGIREVPYGLNGVAFGVDPSGTFNAPRFAVPELLTAGCSRADGSDDAIDVTEALTLATPGELVSFLRSRGIHVEMYPMLQRDGSRPEIFEAKIITPDQLLDMALFALDGTITR